MNAPDLDSLELWVALTWLADHTQRIEFGTLVTPLSYAILRSRHGKRAQWTIYPADD